MTREEERRMLEAHYNTEKYPYFVTNHGQWDIYRDKGNYCAAIPTEEGRRDGCLPSHFGDMQYTIKTLGLPFDPNMWE